MVVLSIYPPFLFYTQPPATANNIIAGRELFSITPLMAARLQAGATGGLTRKGSAPEIAGPHD
jgi:hypothetical protein